MRGEKVDPYEQGLEASMNEQPQGSNPYAAGTAAYTEWMEGWAEGEEDWAASCKQEAQEGRSNPTQKV